MIKMGDAKMCRRNSIFGGCDCFYLTRRGAESALKKGESLDAEDFPQH